MICIIIRQPLFHLRRKVEARPHTLRPERQYSKKDLRGYERPGKPEAVFYLNRFNSITAVNRDNMIKAGDMAKNANEILNRINAGDRLKIPNNE